MDANQIDLILLTVKQKPDLTETERLLLQIIEYLLAENQQLKEENQLLRDEIARLKGEKGKPKFFSIYLRDRKFSGQGGWIFVACGSVYGGNRWEAIPMSY